MSRKLTNEAADKLYEDLSKKTREKLSDRFEKALLCEENIGKYCDKVAFPVDSEEGSCEEVTSFIEENEKRLTESSSKFLTSSKEYYKETLAFTSLKGMKNVVFRKGYRNEAGQREDIINALYIVDCHISLNEYVNQTIAEVEKENRKVPVVLKRVQKAAEKKAVEDVKPNRYDEMKAEKAAKKIQTKKSLFCEIMMWLLLLATAAGAVYVYFYRQLIPFIGVCVGAGLFLIFLIATIALKCKYGRKKLKKALLESWTEKWRNHILESKAASKTIALKREKFTQLYDSALSDWASDKEFVKSLMKKFNSQLFALDRDFLLSIPEEYRSLRAIRQITSYIRSYRTNNLSETYALIEKQRKEKQLEAEEREFKQKQLAIGRMNLSIAQKHIAYTKLQAEYSKRQLEYSKQQTEYSKQQTEYSKQQVDFAKMQAEYYDDYDEEYDEDYDEDYDDEYDEEYDD